MCKSEASTSKEQVKGRPPPKISSREGTPVDVTKVDTGPGIARVPIGLETLLEFLRLNEDIVTKVGKVKMSEIDQGTIGRRRSNQEGASETIVV